MDFSLKVLFGQSPEGRILALHASHFEQCTWNSLAISTNKPGATICEKWRTADCPLFIICIVQRRETGKFSGKRATVLGQRHT